MLRLGFDGGADTLGLGADTGFLGLLLRKDHLDGLAALCDLALSRSDHTLGGFRGVDAGLLSCSPGSGFLERLLMNGDRLLHQDRLDLLFPVHLELAQFALAADAGLVQATVGGDARALDLLAGGDLGLLQRLDAGHFELLDRTAAFEAGGFERLLA